MHGPVGLKLGSKTPPEIAIAILAEMTAIRNGVKIPEFAEPPVITSYSIHYTKLYDAIGILAGIGFYFPLAITTVLTILTLSVFRWIERKVPGEFYAHLEVRFPREAVMPEDES